MRTIVATVSSYKNGTSGELVHNTVEFKATSKRGYKKKAINWFNDNQINPRCIESVWLQDYYEVTNGEKIYLK